MVDEGNDGCENDEWIREWWYVTFLTGRQSWKEYYGVYAREPYATLLPTNHFPRFKNRTQKWGLLSQEDIDFSRQSDDILGSINYGPRSTSLVYYDGNFISSDEYLNLSPNEKKKVSKKLGEFRRLIAVVGLYPKDGDKEDVSLLQCFSWNTWNCGDISPKELRFCSIVWYTQPYEWVVQLCTLMTNFMK